MIEDFSIFCDWQDIDLLENGHLDVEKLEEEQKKQITTYFELIIKNELEDSVRQHQEVLENFYLEIRI